MLKEKFERNGRPILFCFYNRPKIILKNHVKGNISISGMGEGRIGGSGKRRYGIGLYWFVFSDIKIIL